MNNNLDIQPSENIIPLGTISNVMTGEQLMKLNTEEVPYLIEPLFHKAGLVCLAGSSDTGKSSLLRQLAISICTGKEEFLGFKINARHKSSIYVSTEDLARETGSLLKKQTNNCNPEDLKDMIFIFDTEDLITNLDKQLEKKPADTVIIDCFSDVFTNDIKDSTRIRTFLHPYQNLALKHDCLFLFLHHTGKRTEMFPPNKNNLLGGQGLEAKMRLVLELRADLMEPSKKHLCIVKGNYLPSNFKKESYVLDFEESQLLFTNTEQRTPFEFLAKKDETSELKDKYNEITKMSQEGHSYKVIGTKFGVTSSTISKWIAKGTNNGWNIAIGGKINPDKEEE